MDELIRTPEFQFLFVVVMLGCLVKMTTMKKPAVYDPTDEEKAGILLFKLFKILGKGK